MLQPPVHSPPAPRPVRRARTGIFAAILAVSLVGIIVVGGVLLTRATVPVTPPATTVSAEDLKAPVSLITAAYEIGFHPTTSRGAGDVEKRPVPAVIPPSSKKLLAPGTMAPPFTLKTPTGRPVSLEDFRGKAVLLEFFSTWCPHCNAEAPHLRALSKSLPAAKVAFVSVNADGETAPSVFAYHLYYGFDFPALVDPSSKPGSFSSAGEPGLVSAAYKIGTYPTFYVLDRLGRVAWAAEGEQSNALLRKQLLEAAAG